MMLSVLPRLMITLSKPETLLMIAALLYQRWNHWILAMALSFGMRFHSRHTRQLALIRARSYRIVGNVAVGGSLSVKILVLIAPISKPCSPQRKGELAKKKSTYLSCFRRKDDATR